MVPLVTQETDLLPDDAFHTPKNRRGCVVDEG
jgi:hypothetical protein